jgi:NAD(P)-dependent dehydrogenase (short-subunit alcohol dehydrogenase family)
MKKTALITGGSGSLGKAVVEKFLKEDYQVIIIVTPGKGSTFHQHDRINVYEADLTNEVQTSEVIGTIIKKFGTIDAALLLVGGYASGGIKDTDGQALKKMFSLNFDTAYFTARPVFLQMKNQSKGGRIILVGSRPALSAKDGKNALAYGLSKSLLFKLAEYLNADGASSKVITSVLVPSTIDTAENRKAMPDKNFNDWVTPEEIAETMAFLCSEKTKSLREPVIKMFGNS